MIRVAIIDDHPVIWTGAIAVLEAEPDITVVSTTATPEEFLESGIEADVVLLDLRLKEGRSIWAIPALKEDGRAVLAYTQMEEPEPLRSAVATGAIGVVLKSDDPHTLAQQIRDAADGTFLCTGKLAELVINEDPTFVDLSAAEYAVVDAIADGLNYVEAAERTTVAEGTVKSHLAAVRAKIVAAGHDPGNTSIHRINILRRQGYELGG